VFNKLSSVQLSFPFPLDAFGDSRGVPISGAGPGHQRVLRRFRIGWLCCCTSGHYSLFVLYSAGLCFLFVCSEQMLRDGISLWRWYVHWRRVTMWSASWLLWRIRWTRLPAKLVMCNHQYRFELREVTNKWLILYNSQWLDWYGDFYYFHYIQYIQLSMMCMMWWKWQNSPRKKF